MATIKKLALIISLLAGLCLAQEWPVDAITDLGQPIPGVINVWILATTIGQDGKIYGGTSDGYPGSHIFVFDPSTKAFTDLGAPGIEVYSLTTGIDSLIYGGSYKAPGHGAHFFIYNPALPWNPGNTPANNPYDLGPPMTASVPSEAIIYALTTGLVDGMIYGGTGYAYDVGVYDYACLFIYNPYTKATINLGSPIPNQQAIIRIVAGLDGKIYGATVPGGYLFVYDPTTGMFSNLGQPMPGGSINALTVGQDGKIYGATSPGAHFFVYDPIKKTIEDKGSAVNDQLIWTLATGRNGKVYGGSAPLGYFISYDPYLDWNPGSTQQSNPRNYGQAVSGETRVRTLVTANDGLIYGGTALSAHFFVFVPTVKFRRDVGITTIFEPRPRETAGMPIIPQIGLLNFGQITETFNAQFTIVDSLTSSVIYDNTVIVGSLAPGEYRVIPFPEWYIPGTGGVYYSTASIFPAEDALPTNDTLTQFTRVEKPVMIEEGRGWAFGRGVGIGRRWFGWPWQICQRRTEYAYHVTGIGSYISSFEVKFPNYPQYVSSLGGPRNDYGGAYPGWSRSFASPWANWRANSSQYNIPPSNRAWFYVTTKWSQTSLETSQSLRINGIPCGTFTCHGSLLLTRAYAWSGYLPYLSPIYSIDWDTSTYSCVISDNNYVTYDLGYEKPIKYVCLLSRNVSTYSNPHLIEIAVGSQNHGEIDSVIGIIEFPPLANMASHLVTLFPDEPDHFLLKRFVQIKILDRWISPVNTIPASGAQFAEIAFYPWPAIGVVVSAFDGEKNISPDTTISLSFNVYNLGPPDDEYLITVVDSLNWQCIPSVSSIFLPEGQNSVIKVEVTVPSQIGLRNRICLTAASVANSQYRDSADVYVNTIIPSDVVVHPEVLNRKSQGRWVTGYVEFPEGFNVNDIDSSMVTLVYDTSVVYAESTPSEIGDYDKDGIVDRSFKFDRQKFIKILSDLPSGTKVKLDITGYLKTHQVFSGTTEITVIGPSGGPQASDDNVAVNATDFSLEIKPNIISRTGKFNISFTLPQKSQVKIKIYDITGREVTKVYESRNAYGCHQIGITPEKIGIGSGIYFLRMETDQGKYIKRVIIY